jgi:hypothetical protein
MSEKKRQKKDGEDKNKNNQREREANGQKESRPAQDSQDEAGRNPNYK